MGLGDLLDGAVKLFMANWRALLLTVAVVVVPVQLVVAWLARDITSTGLFQLFTDPTAFDLAEVEQLGGADVGAFLITLWVSVLVLPVLTGAVCAIAGGSYVGRPVAWKAALQVAGRRGGSLVGATILIGIVQFLVVVPALLIGIAVLATGSGGLLLLAVLLLLLGAVGVLAISGLYTATVPAIVTEDLGPAQGMGRSWRLRRPRLWPTVVAVLVAGLLSGIVGLMISGLLSFAGSFAAGGFAWVLVGAGEILAQLIQIPFLAIVSTLLYFDGRIRNEGFDLQIAAGELGE